MRRVVLVALALSASSVARAGESQEVLVLEAQVGNAVLQPGRLLGAFLDGWGPGAQAGETLTKSIESKLSRSPGRVGGYLSQIRTALAAIEDQRLMRTGEWGRIVELLEPIHAAVPRNVAAVATDPKTRGALFESLVLLLRAYQGQHKAEGTQAALRLASDLVGSFGDFEISVATRGPAFFEFYKAAAEREKKRARHQLVVEVSSAGCRVFVNEVQAGLSPRVTRSVASGTHRLFADCGQGRHSRVWEVVVNDDLSVKIDLAFDATVDTTGDMVTLLYPSEATRSRLEAANASRIARTLGLKRVVVFGTEKDERSGASSLYGRMYDASTEVTLQSHAIVLAGDAVPPPSTARELAERLRAKQEGRIEVIPVTRSPSRPQVVTTPQADSAPRVREVLRLLPREPRPIPPWPGWVAAGVGAVGVGLGAALLASDGKPTCQYDDPSGAHNNAECRLLYNTGREGAIVVAIGGALVVGGVVWGAILQARHRRR